MFTVENDSGRKFTVRFVHPGDSYGRNNSLKNETNEIIVEFYDQTHANKKDFGNLGQFVSRYYASTLQNDQCSKGINLEGGVKEWTISYENKLKVTHFLSLVQRYGKDVLNQLEVNSVLNF